MMMRVLAVSCLLLAAPTGCDGGGDESRAGSVSDCSSLCRLTATASGGESACAAITLSDRGYPDVYLLDECIDVELVSECNACYQALGTTTEDCLAVRDACVKN